MGPKPRKSGGPKGGAQKGGAQKGGAQKGGEPKISRARLEFSVCRVKPRRLRDRRGFTRQPENSIHAHFRVPAFKNTTKIQRKDPEKREEKENCGGREQKKREILGHPPFGAPPFWAPPFGPTFSRFGLSP